jgi:hypothetical protein
MSPTSDYLVDGAGLRSHKKSPSGDPLLEPVLVEGGA